MSQSKLTSNDVVRHAGVSQSIVSRSFAPDSPISVETRAQVMAAAAELGYQPNAIARSLITQHTSIVGIVMASPRRLKRVLRSLNKLSSAPQKQVFQSKMW
jgi:DNA-binding LacI/PurR family transcriptional regulator